MSTSDPWSTPTPRRSRCAPAVVADVPNDSRLVQDESTGPVLTVQVFNTRRRPWRWPTAPPTAWPPACTDGRRPGGYGCEYGPEGLDEYLQTKSVYVAR
jgi:acyl-CoA reductase-like NAD-dependent aldehyde dehydrogenase